MSENRNFGLALAGRCAPQSCLIEAASGRVIGGAPPLSEIIARSAAFFASHGLRAGDRLVVAGALTARAAVAYLGALYGGLETAVVDRGRLWRSPSPDLSGLDPVAAVWSEEPDVLVATAAAGIRALAGDPTAFPDTMSPAFRRGTDVAVLASTSGTAGSPRYVMVSHDNLIANTAAIARSQHLQPSVERAMLILPFSYCFGASVLHSHLWCGGSVVLDSRFMFPDKVLAAIAEWSCTSFAGVPSVFKVLLRRSSLGRMPLPSLVRFLQAGGPLDVGSIGEIRRRQPRTDFYAMYGQTEATARISCLDPAALERKAGSVGQPLDNLEVEIRDAAGRPVGVSQRGRIWVRGPSVCLGYLDDPAEARKVFVDGWLCTRDIGWLDADGYLWIEARSEHFLKVRGVRLSFDEIEAFVRQIPGVSDAAAIAVAHDEAGEVPVVFVVPLDRPGPALADVVSARLPPSWTCEKVIVVPALPLNDRGKVDQLILQQLARDR